MEIKQREVDRRFKRNIKRFVLYSIIIFSIIYAGGGFRKEKKVEPLYKGPIDTRKYSKAYDTVPHTRTLPTIKHSIEVQVNGKTYQADVDFEELMDQMGIDPEDIREYIE